MKAYSFFINVGHTSGTLFLFFDFCLSQSYDRLHLICVMVLVI